MQLAEQGGQGGVLDHAVLEVRHAMATQLQLVEHAGDPFVLGVEATIAPACLVCRGAGVQLVRVDQHHAAHRCQVLAATMPESLGAGLDHSEHVAFMHMGGEALLEIPRVQHFHIAQCRGLPEVGLFARGRVHASQLRRRKKINMLTSMLSNTLRVNSTRAMATSEPSR